MMRTPVGSAVLGRAAAGAVCVCCVVLGCRSAAAAFFDIPEREVAPEPVEGRTAVLPIPIALDTVPPPPIESMMVPDSVLALLPRDRAGFVDWHAAKRDGTIRPRRHSPGDDDDRPSLEGFAFDFLIAGPNEMFDAIFPHSAHVEWLECQSCHPALFPYRNATITMQEINEGESCGTCHGAVAFPPASCERCHQQVSMPEARATAELRGAVVWEQDTTDVNAAPYPSVRFEHWVHRVRYQCSACHPEPFAMERGATDVSMESMQQGETCGVCHDGEEAFGLVECARCHVGDRGG